MQMENLTESVDDASLINNKAYSLGQQIGIGAYGIVCKCIRQSDGVLMVMKILRQQCHEAVLREYKLLRQLDHVNVVRCVDCFEDSNQQSCLVMEYCDGGDIGDLIKTMRDTGRHFSEEEVLPWCVQMLRAVQHCHQNLILHRDIKPANVFLMRVRSSTTSILDDIATTGMTASAILKLGDFGVSKLLDTTCSLASTVAGTPYSLPPELCDSQPYSYGCDVWALGILFYELLTTRHAFDGPSLLKLIWNIVNTDQEPLPSHYSAALQDLISRMLIKDPTARPSCDDLLALPFLSVYITPSIAIATLTPTEASTSMIVNTHHHHHYNRHHHAILHRREAVSAPPTLRAVLDDAVFWTNEDLHNKVLVALEPATSRMETPDFDNSHHPHLSHTRRHRRHATVVKAALTGIHSVKTTEPNITVFSPENTSTDTTATSPAVSNKSLSASTRLRAIQSTISEKVSSSVHSGVGVVVSEVDMGGIVSPVSGSVSAAGLVTSQYKSFRAAVYFARDPPSMHCLPRTAAFVPGRPETVDADLVLRRRSFTGKLSSVGKRTPPTMSSRMMHDVSSFLGAPSSVQPDAFHKRHSNVTHSLASALNLASAHKLPIVQMIHMRIGHTFQTGQSARLVTLQSGNRAPKIVHNGSPPVLVNSSAPRPPSSGISPSMINNVPAAVALPVSFSRIPGSRGAFDLQKQAERAACHPIHMPERAVAPRQIFAPRSFFSPGSHRSADSSGHTSIQSSPPVRVSTAHEQSSTPSLQTHHHLHVHAHVPVAKSIARSSAAF